MAHVQCLLCKKRRVKCDSTQPACRRCLKDGRNCPGYSETLKWISFDPTKSKRLPIMSMTSSPKCSEDVQGLTAASTEAAAIQNDREPALSLSALAPRLDTELERRCWHVTDSVAYCNSVVIPDLVPYPYARTYHMRLEDWLRAPSILHSIVLVVTFNHRIVRRVGDVGALTALYKYRGEALRELASEISSSEKLSPLLGLIGVLMVIQAEIQISAASSWDVHLQAAHALIDQLGGIAKCWQNIPSMRMLFALHFLVETLSAVTTPSSLLSQQELQEAGDNLARLAGVEQMLLASCGPVPLPILAAITQINTLRGEVKPGSVRVTAERSEQQQKYAKECQCILADLDRFDAEEWANRIISDFPDNGMFSERAIPRFRELEASEWMAIAQCYHSAVIIYLLRSVVCSSGFSLHVLWANSEAPIQRLQAEAYTLGTSLDKLFLCFGDQRSTSLRPGLWRFTMFPLFIHTLEMLVWHKPSLSEQAQRHYLERMLSLGQKLGCRTMATAVECIEKALQLKKQDGRRPSWDECFGTIGRSVFVI
jgi:hypothetical protein